MQMLQTSEMLTVMFMYFYSVEVYCRGFNLEKTIKKKKSK